MANEIHPITPSEGEIVLYHPDENISLEVKLDTTHETVWLTRQQMATLFGRDVKPLASTSTTRFVRNYQSLFKQKMTKPFQLSQKMR